MYKYLLSNTNGVSTLSFYDQAGSQGYSLRLIIVQTNTKAVTQTPIASAPIAVPPATAATLPPLSPGTYLLLLLQRRDLPRLLVNVTSNTLVYKSCNNIKQTFTPSSLTANQGSISFSGGATASNTCTINNDQVYYGTLNQAKSYNYDPAAGAIIISNSAGVQVATLSRAS